MSGKCSVTSFDLLASEVLFEIFDYLSYFDVVHAFSSLNQRFTAILSHYRRLLKTFTTPTRDFPVGQTFLSTISSQIEHLAITTTEFRVPLDSLPNLKSLVICSPLPIYYDELALLLQGEQFKRLNSLKIKNEIIRNDNRDETPYCDKILHCDNSLRIFESLAEQCVTHRNMNDLRMNENLRSLSLKVSNLTNLVLLLDYTPNLKYLTVAVFIFGVPMSQLPSINLSHIKLKSCSIFIHKGAITVRSFPLLMCFIQQFSSSLVELSLDSHHIKICQSLFTDSVVEQQLLQPMVHLKSLNLYLQLYDKPMNVKSFLSIFQTPFWLDHHWTFAMHGYYLYTLPFHFETLDGFIDFEQIESSNSHILNSCQMWARMKSVEFSHSFQFRSSIIDEFNSIMPTVRSIILNSHLRYSLLQNVTEVNRALDAITTVHCPAEWLRPSKHWLRHIFPNLKRLMLTHSSARNAVPRDSMAVSQELDAYFNDAKTRSIYPFKIEYVEIKVTLHEVNRIYQDTGGLLGELLRMSANLQSIILHFYHLPEFPTNIPYMKLEKTIGLLNMRQIRKHFSIKHVRNYMQFVRI